VPKFWFRVQGQGFCLHSIGEIARELVYWFVSMPKAYHNYTVLIVG